MSEDTKARLTMASTEGDYATYMVIESEGDFGTTILENAVEGHLPQYNMNPPWLAVGEEVSATLAIEDSSPLVRHLLTRAATAP